MRSPRLVGIDVARGLAVLGMFAAHTVPRAGDAELLVDGRSSILFATLAGMSIGLMTGGTTPPGRGARAGSGTLTRFRARRGILVRAVLLFALGVGLAALPSGIAIILDYYGVMFLLLVPALFLPRPALAAAAAVLLAVTPLVVAALPQRPAGVWAEAAGEYLLHGSYPALVWLPLLLIGLLAARSGLHRASTAWWMLASGASSAATGYGLAAVSESATAEAHSGSLLELLGSGGVAVAVVGLMLLLARNRIVSVVLGPVAAVGAMPLTVYTTQILLLAAVTVVAEQPGLAAQFGLDPTSGVLAYPGWPLFLTLTAAALVLCPLWRRFVGPGPLEMALRVASGFGRRPTGGESARRIPSTRRGVAP